MTLAVRDCVYKASICELYLLEQAKEHVCVNSSLMGLIQHNDGILAQIRVNQTLS